MQQMDLIFTKTSDDLSLPGFYYPSDNKDLCVLLIHGMSGIILENYFGHVLGQELQKQGIGYIFTHNRGYAHINDIRTSEKNSNGEFNSKRNGTVYERFEGCVFDIEAWLQKARELGYKRFVVIGHSLGAPKVVHHFFKNKPVDVVGVVIASPADMVGLVKKPEYQANYEELLSEARQNVENRNPDKLLSGQVWEWYTLSSQTFLDLFEDHGPADNLPILRNPDRFPELEVINVPTLCVMGENDDVAIKTLEEDMDLLKQKAINAPVFDTCLIPGAPHGYDDKEMEFAVKIIDFLNSRVLNQ